MNSFSAMSRAIDFEICRQVNLHKQGQGDQIVQETRLWDDGSQVCLAHESTLRSLDSPVPPF